MSLKRLDPSCLVLPWLLLAACEAPSEPVDDQTGAIVVADGGSHDGGAGDGGAQPDAKIDAESDAGTDAKTDGSAGGDGQGEVVPGAKEACGDLTDDDGDGLVDEGCLAPPSLRPGLGWTDLGYVELQAKVGAAPTRMFAASAKDQGMVLVAREAAGQPPLYVWLETLKSPSGLQVLSTGGWEGSYNRAYPGIGGSTALVGMAPQVSLVAGPWTFGFTRSGKQPLAYAGTPAAGWLHLGVLSRPEIQAQATAMLDLDIVLVGGTPEPAASFGKSAQWKEIIQRVETVWKPAKLKLGTVRFLELGGDAGKKYKFLDNVLSGGADNELPGVYAAVGQLDPKATAVTVVVVAGLHDGNGMQVAAGLSQLAGAPGLVGSRLGGIALVVDPAEWTQAKAAGNGVAGDRWGVVLAHEIGHFLGLWHTDEFDGSLHDPLDDTPSCEKKGTLTPEACPSQSKNLMFWSPKGTTVSDAQAKVVRRHPALR